jgi:hypothetical protein
MKSLVGFGSHFKVWAVAVIIATVGGPLSGCSGQSYSCGTPDANHCYGVVSWSGSPTGFSMEVTAVALASGNIFVDDEGWLVDYFAQGNPLAGAYWVETGEINEGAGTDYFWANNTANDGFMSYDLGPVAQSDIHSGAWIAYRINQDSRISAQWNVTISRAATGTMLYSAQSTETSMTPNTVIEGQELAGEQGAQAPLAFFSENSVIHGSTIEFQSTDGTVTANRPPNAGWLGTDTPSQTGNGGMFLTDCC